MNVCSAYAHPYTGRKGAADTQRKHDDQPGDAQRRVTHFTISGPFFPRSVSGGSDRIATLWARTGNRSSTPQTQHALQLRKEAFPRRASPKQTSSPVPGAATARTNSTGHQRQSVAVRSIHTVQRNPRRKTKLGARAENRNRSYDRDWYDDP